MNMSITNKLAIILTAVSLLASCSYKPQEDSMSDLDSSSSTSANDSSTSSGDYSSTGSLGDITPGSVEDFIVNLGDRVFFELNSSDLTAEAQETLKMQAAWLNRYLSTTVTIEGHADERGTREYNLALGARRANSVIVYLQTLGIKGDRLTSISYGKERPAVTGSNEEAWSQNRRGVLVVQEY